MPLNPTGTNSRHQSSPHHAATLNKIFDKALTDTVAERLREYLKPRTINNVSCPRTACNEVFEITDSTTGAKYVVSREVYVVEWDKQCLAARAKLFRKGGV